MMKHALPFALLGLLLITTSCRHWPAKPAAAEQLHGEEEALPVSSLPEEEFSRVSPQRGSRRR